jgi:hypothetical protein
MPLCGREERVRLARYICRSPGQRAYVLYTYEGKGSLVAGDAGFLPFAIKNLLNERDVSGGGPIKYHQLALRNSK